MSSTAPKQETVFLCGTDRVQDVMNELAKELRQLGFIPRWFRSPDFPSLAKDAMTNCLKVAGKSDKMILVIDERAGLPYRKSGITITEAEFREAYKRGKDCLVFIRERVWQQSRVYHRKLKKLGAIDKDTFSSLELDGDQAVYDFIERLEHLERRGVPSIPWIEPFKLSDDIIKCIRAKWAPSESEQILIRPSSNLHSEEASLFEEAVSAKPALSEEALYQILNEYSDDLPDELRQTVLRNLIADVWPVVVYDSIIAADLVTNDILNKRSLAILLVPLCKVALKKELTALELTNFVDLIRSNQSFFGEDLRQKAHALLISRLLMYLFYHQPGIFSSVDAHELLNTFAAKSDPFWDVFFVDLYLRSLCDYVLLPSDCFQLVETVFLRYKSASSEDVLVRLYPFVATPYEALRKHSKAEDVLDIIKYIARDCKNSIECKWCITSLLRTLPLYELSDEELDFGKVIAATIREFDQRIISSSPRFHFLFLSTLLRSFLRRKNPNYLAEYEKEFLRRRSSLLDPQVIHLQLEYAASLYACSQFLGQEGLDTLLAGKLIRAHKSLTQSPLFSNVLIKSNVKLKQPLIFKDTYKGNLFRWLNIYTRELFLLYAKRSIEENHLRFHSFRASTHVYDLRPLFGKAVLKSLRFFVERPVCQASFYAKSTAAFGLVSRQDNTELMYEYVTRALQGDKYSILRNAKDISHCIYSCYYYGSPTLAAAAAELANRFYELSGIGDTTTVGIHWAYYAGLRFKDRKIERMFLDDLYRKSEKANKGVQRLALRTGETLWVEFSDATKSTIDLYVSKSSLFAKALAESLINPEIWNLIATTLLNDGDQADLAFTLKQAAYFYSFAKCFARTNKDYDQKYCYNYIRCMSLYYEKSGLLPSKNFLKDTVFYLKRPESRLFGFKVSCVGPLMDVVETYWDHLPEESKAFICETSKIDWIQQAFSSQLSKMC